MASRNRIKVRFCTSANPSAQGDFGRCEHNESDRLVLTAKEAARKKLKQLCSKYDSQPVGRKTDSEVEHFSLQQAHAAQKSLLVKEGNKCRKINDKEMLQYAQTVKSAVESFNKKSADHRRLMKHRDECQHLADEMAHAEADKKEQAAKTVIRII